MSLSWKERIVIAAIGAFTLAIVFMALAYAGLAVYAGAYVQAIAALGIAALGFRSSKNMIAGKTP